MAFFAVVAGLIGVHFYREATRPKPIQQAPVFAAEKPKVRTMTVPMVSRTLKPGQTVTMDDVALVKLTREQLEKNGINKAFMSKPEQIIGKTIKRELRRGSTFDTRDFYPQGQGPGIVHRVKPGQRAITVTMLPTNALVGFAGAGQSVDVLFHYGRSDNQRNQRQQNDVLQPQNNRNRRRNDISPALQSATSTLIQGAEILAFNQQSLPVEEAKNLPLDRRVLVTLSVYPREAELLRMASGHGELSLTLRSPSDKETVPTVTPRTFDEIIDVRENVQQMEIYRGNRVSRLHFSGGTIIKRTVSDGSRPQLTGSGSKNTTRDAVQADSKPRAEQESKDAPLDYREYSLNVIEEGDPFLLDNPTPEPDLDPPAKKKVKAEPASWPGGR